jgi:nicotinamide-nucleotide amidase
VLTWILFVLVSKGFSAFNSNFFFNSTPAAGSAGGGLANDVFLGSITAYRPEIKISHLHVSKSAITEHSVVSEEVAIEMARGAMKTFGSTWAIATTGVAGPGPSDGSEAGRVFVAFVGPSLQVIELSLSGEREVVRNATVASAIASFARILRQRDTSAPAQQKG